MAVTTKNRIAETNGRHMPSLDANPSFRRVQNDLTRLGAELKLTQSTLDAERNKANRDAESWQEQAARAMSKGEPLPPRAGPDDSLQAAMEHHGLVSRALGLARGRRDEIIQAETRAAILATTSERESILRRKLAAMTELLEAEKMDDVYYDRMQAAGFAMAWRERVRFLPVDAIALGIANFEQRVRDWEPGVNL